MAGIMLYRFCESAAIAAAIIVVAVMLWLTKRRYAAFVALSAALGWSLMALNRPAQPPESLMGRRSVCKGRIEAVTHYPSSLKLTVTIDSFRPSPSAADTPFHSVGKPFKASLLIPSTEPETEVGDHIMFRATPLSVAGRQDLPYEADYNSGAYVAGVTATAHVAPDEITVTGHSPGIITWADRMRGRLTDIIYSSPVSSPTAWFLNATLLGDDSYLEPEVREEFRASGTAHYLALSGFHVGIITIIAGFLLFPMKAWRRAGRLRHLAVIGLIWFYALITGLTPSVVRAATLITVFLLARVLQRQSNPFNSLAVAAILILAVSPRALFSVGFGMSFGAVAAILLFARALNPFTPRQRVAYVLMEYVAVTVAATLGTGLFAAVCFHRFPLLFLPANLFAALILPLIMGLGLLLMALTAMGLDAWWLGSAIDWLYGLSHSSFGFIASLPFAEIKGIFMPWPAVIAAVATLFFLAATVNLRHKRFYSLMTLALLAVTAGLWLLCAERIPESELFVTRASARTDIVARNGRNCYLITTARENDRDYVRRQLTRRYGDYLASRGCDSLILCDGDFKDGPVALSGPYIIFGDKTVLRADGYSYARAREGIKTDYMIFGRHSNRAAIESIAAIRPDSVIVTPGLHPKRLARLIAVCDSTKTGLRRLDDRPLFLKIE